MSTSTKNYFFSCSSYTKILQVAQQGALKRPVFKPFPPSHTFPTHPFSHPKSAVWGVSLQIPPFAFRRSML